MIVQVSIGSTWFGSDTITWRRGEYRPSVSFRLSSPKVTWSPGNGGRFTPVADQLNQVVSGFQMSHGRNPAGDFPNEILVVSFSGILKSWVYDNPHITKGSISSPIRNKQPG